MNLILATVLLCGPPVAHMRQTVPLAIHLGRSQRSAIARAELARVDPFFSHRRFAIESHFRLSVDDDALDDPTYQLGSGDTRHKFPQGAFASSGSFILTLESMCAIDRWDRQMPSYGLNHLDRETMEWVYKRNEDDKPAVFPPEEK